MTRLLAVSWEMPPMYGPRATQVARALGALAAIGWQSTVVCMAPRRGGPHWPDEAPVAPPAGVDLVRVPSPEDWTVVRAAWRVAPPLRDYPDTKRVWVGPATRAALAAAAAGKPAGLVTFAQPWSSHLVGLRVRRETALPWVAHFSDPWVDSPYATARQRAIWRPLEADVVREAAALVFVSEEIAELVMRKYPAEWRDKVSVVPQGFDARTAAVGASPRRAGPLRIVYTGRFYAGVRTPLALLRALAVLKAADPLAGALELTFVGPHVDAFARDATALGVDSLVRFQGRVAPAEAAAVAADADVLLVIDAPSTGPSVFLPSKLIDYLPFRKPVLGVTPEPGAAAALLRRLGCPVAPPDDVDAIAAALADLVRRSRAATLGVSESFDRVAAEFEIGRVAGRFNDVLVRAFEP
ncbi:MAG TPA: glycosyltransferase [Vicinamibacterales bacterium]